MALAISSAVLAFVGAGPLCADSPGAPQVIIESGQSPLYIGGDCNSPVTWAGDQLHVFSSPYPQGDFMGGVAAFRSGPSIEGLNGVTAVSPDRSQLAAYPFPVYGPWFESVVSDDDGVLWAYYHAEFTSDVELGKLHPKVGAQVSHDGGITWQDLGIILDTPADTDDFHSWLGCNFSGGNGDCSVILDPSHTYLYIFYSQYGSDADTQGVAVARMRWSDRGAPVGKVLKWSDGAWSEPGLGGHATPFLPNVGDAHGKRANFDFWWGPSIHWNTHLQRYVILLNRSNSPDFTFQNGVANWYFTAPSLDDPTSWDTPQPLPFPDGYGGDWYPQVIGTGPGETDSLAGGDARLFVAGQSTWIIHFLRPDEVTVIPGIQIVPTTVAAIPDLAASAGQPFSATLPTAAFSSADGDPLNWSVCRLLDWLSFDPQTLQLSGTPPADAPASLPLTATVTDAAGLQASSSFALTISPPPPNRLPDVSIAVEGGGCWDYFVAPGTTLNLTSRATDPDGNLLEHWMELQNPEGEWSWEGWLTDPPFTGDLVGDGYASEKSTAYTFTELGTYNVRTTALDPDGVWIVSWSVRIHVVDTELEPSE